MLVNTLRFADLGQKHFLRLLYLFGSRGKDAAAPTSDFDFAAVFEETQPMERLRRAADLELDLLKLVGGKVDLVALNDADPVLRFEAIGGRLLYACSERERVLFEAAVLCEYQDSAHRRRIYAEANRRYFLERRS